jgi:CYTH domain-containing protein
MQKKQKKIQKAKPKLEIEKRILLKRVPLDMEFDEVQDIHQYYGPSGRLRHVKNRIARTVQYIHTTKKTVSKGVNQETEVEISKDLFTEELKRCTKRLYKVRYIKKTGKYKWEIDEFFGMVIAEIEVNTKKELKTVKIPRIIKNEMVAEITGDKRFSNFNLADPWKKTSL